MTVTYITRDGTKIDGTTGQDHLLEVIYGHALTRMLLRPFLSPAVSDICKYKTFQENSPILCKKESH